MQNVRKPDLFGFQRFTVSLYSKFQDECNGYGFEVDAWACGVIMYTLLIGRPPFWHRKQMMLIRQIMRGEYTMTGPDWAEVTSETRDLVNILLLRQGLNAGRG